MRRIYYLTEEVDSAEQIEKDLLAFGIEDKYIHVISHHEMEEHNHQLHSSNVLLRSDLPRSLERGSIIGALFGVILGTLLMWTDPFGYAPGLVTLAVVIVCFAILGAWIGGFAGISKENYKISKFHHQLEEGQYLVFVDAKQDEIASIDAMMKYRHPESTYGGEDSSYTNPFKGEEQVKQAA